MITFIGFLMFIGLICAISAVADICGDHIEDWWKGKLKRK
jgi:hypothetical protein